MEPGHGQEQLGMGRTGAVCVLVLAAVLVSGARVAYADGVEDAEQLKDEAKETIRTHSTKPVPPKEYAMAIYKLEKAQSLLETEGQNTGALAEEINTQLFWARRCSTIHIIKELDKIHAENPPLKLASKEKKKKTEDGEMVEADPLAEAKAAFEAAEAFAKAHSADDYLVSLRWFQMANEYPGNDYAMKAMSLARDAQMRYAVKNGSFKEELPDTPEMKPIRDGDALVEQGKYEQATEVYKQSIKIKDNMTAHRRLGQTFFRRAQQMKDELMPKFDSITSELKAATDGAYVTVGSGKSTPKVFNPNYPPLVAAKKKHQDLLTQANQAMVRYLYAQWEFEKVLKMAEGNRDFDAAAYIAVSLSARPEEKGRAVPALQKFLKEYEPFNDLERFIYEYCKTELERLTAK
ncbi:MAG TPA: tetratricopeptide repeat protein [Planctomycetota bacterium]|nr:tetratricopeptide repeat protein [Planctomycetota bacterium]